MRDTVTIDHDCRTLAVHFSGEVTLLGQLMLIEDLASLLRDHAGYGVFLDYSEASGEPRSAEGFAMAATLEAHRVWFRGGMALGGLHGYRFDVARLMCSQARSRGLRVQAFTDTDSAREWLVSDGGGDDEAALAGFEDA